MSGQHVGSLSDSINNEDELRAAMRDRVKIKPTGKVFRGVSDVGDGDPCPVEGHGKKYTIKGSTRQWCPNQSHGAERMTRDERHEGQHDLEMCASCRVAVGMSEDQD